MKKKIIIVFLILFLILLGFLSVIFFKNLGKDNEKDYVSEFTTIGEEAYREYYYKIISIDKTEADIIAYLKKFEQSGLKFDLEALRGYAINSDKEEYINIIDEFLERNKKCDENNTKVIIYPKEPYKNTDFTSEIKMNCEVK